MKANVYFLIIFLVFFNTKSLSIDATQALKANFVFLKINNHKIVAEIADNEVQRIKGLMFRKSLPKDQGMFFKYKTSKIRCMWMKNTSIPLSVAFINSEYTIVNIKKMIPFDETPHCSISPSMYALEMKSGWFRDRKIKKGQKVTEYLSKSY
ncbi:MAG: hypothetical protein CBD16_04415 [Betaproteobacteria bacterium TMED156]|nr:MAG: hypothetical protein CBD16_04415 [Betaproteobacteria bacterium TMED156]